MKALPRFLRFSALWLAAGLLQPLPAAPVTLWEIGQDEDPYADGYAPADEFAVESYATEAAPGRVTRLPGDPQYNASSNPAADDHHYLAGSYPTGFNGLTSTLNVPNSEPNLAFERVLSSGDPTNWIHFPLQAGQLGPNARFRLTFDLVDGGSWSASASGENFGTHNVEVRFRNGSTTTLLLQRNGIDRPTRFTLEFPASSVSAIAGPNSLQFTRTGPTPPATFYTWIHFDFIKLEVDPDALADADQDGLPRWWEEANRLSDQSAADAAQDLDGDGLTNLQEYHNGVLSSDPRRSDTDDDGLTDSAEQTAGSNPNLSDTDGDGLSDFEEIQASPASSPTLADTDQDGFPDAWEKRVGSSPTISSSVPTAFAGAIGLNFVCSESPAGTVPWLHPAGVIPQLYWNNTTPLRTWDRTTGNTTLIATPTAGTFTRSNGQTIPGMTVQWTSDQTNLSWNDGSPDQKLMNGLIRAYGSTPATLTLQGIPFSTYHVFAYVGGGYDGQRGTLRLNQDPGTDRAFRTQTTAPTKTWTEVPAPTTAIPVPIGNVIYYPSRTGSTLSLSLQNNDGYSVGIHAIQIIDATLDADNSGIPDWYEMKYQLQPAGPGTANADPDGDGLSNLQEFQRNSNPRLADTDGDGLTDSAEPAANVTLIDSDGDGISDYDEVHAPIPSNPSLADTDNDGIPDKIEQDLGLDPTVNASSSPGFIGWVPLYTASPTPTWEWKLDPIQIVWDHGEGAPGGNDGYSDTLASFQVGNLSTDSDRSLDLRLRSVNGALTYQFESFADEAFSASNNPTGNVYLVDGNVPPTDLKSALGFSGYGPHDISDQLRFRFLATKGSGNSWQLTFEIRNLTRNTAVVSRSISLSTAGPTLNNGTATWQNAAGVPGIPTISLNEGTRIFVTPTPLESLPAFAAFTDSDNDGMPNAWELLYSFNPNSAADATQDADGDGVKNRDECLDGTHPRLTDTDGDGVDDRIEREEGTNPLVATLRPLFSNGLSISGTDLNQNGFPDLWEATFNTTGLNATTDNDGDGASNAREALWGTDPFDPESRIGISLTRSGNDALLSWTRSQWKRQRIQRSTDLSSWQFLSLPTTTDGLQDHARIVNSFALTSRAFFTVETKDRDSDGDGIPDWDEIAFGSDPYSRDSLRSGSLTLDAEGNVTGNVSGDYAAFASRFRNTLPGGPGGQVTREQAARFLQQATFGPTLEEIDHVQSLGFSAWINNQIQNTPPSLQRPVMEAMTRDLRGPRLDLKYAFSDLSLSGSNTSSAFARAAVAGPDQLRQRVAFALSQILVTSKRDPNLTDRPVAMADYYDIFIRHAFGNYRDVLGEVSRHPVMGRYLSHIGNQKARPEINQYPDENYARELMQLFTIGLWELNQDGTRKVDSGGHFIPTYTNADITEVARVFTGFWFGGQPWGGGGYLDEHLTVPMRMFEEKHDFSAKSFLGGRSIPARAVSIANAQRDVDDLLDHLFQHPNTAPFVSRQLIQFLVTSNPSPAYVSRVAAVFADNGSGKRGDLAAVTRAILLDEEARDARWSIGSPTFGRLKDPVQRSMGLARTARLERYPSLHWWDYGDYYEASLQSPSSSPSVFNFYRPDYRSPGVLTENQLSGPAFQITNSYTSIAFVNRLWRDTVDGIRLYELYAYPPDYRDLLEVADQPARLADRINLLLCGGTMSASTRADMINMLTQVSAGDPLQRVQLAVFLAASCPEGAVQR